MVASCWWRFPKVCTAPLVCGMFEMQHNLRVLATFSWGGNVRCIIGEKVICSTPIPGSAYMSLVQRNAGCVCFSGNMSQSYFVCHLFCDVCGAQTMLSLKVMVSHLSNQFHSWVCHSYLFHWVFRFFYLLRCLRDGDFLDFFGLVVPKLVHAHG